MKKFELLHQKKNSFAKMKWKHQFRNVSFETSRKISRNEFDAFYLLSIDSPIFLKTFLGISFDELVQLINYPEYFEYGIKKKKGGIRQISAPTKNLKKIQKRLNYYLQRYYYLIKPEEVFGFIRQPKRSNSPCPIAENARVHTQKKEVLNIDLKDFFNSVSANRVKRLFTSEVFCFDENIATSLALLTTFERKLPTGAPTSPVISNFICLNMDEELALFCRENQLHYSRYADDLTFSSNDDIHTDLLLDIIGIIHAHGFNINEKKLRMKTTGRRQTVTGLVVNEKVNVPRSMIKNSRAMLHDLSYNGLETATKNHFKIKGEIPSELRLKFFYKLAGNINFIGQIRGRNDNVYVKLQEKLNGFITAYSE